MGDVWKVEHGKDFATLYSAERMPHSSRKGPMDAARKALRAAIEHIVASPGEILEGEYSSNIDGFFDVENVVFYNVETATFRSSTKHGLRARRCRSHFEASSHDFAHRMDYRLIPIPEVPQGHLVQLQFEPAGFRSVFDVWWAASNGRLIRSGAVGGAYGLHVELSDQTLPSNPAGKMKKLFDGIIAALQRDSMPDPEAIARLSTKHGVDGTLIESRLLNPICESISASRSARLVRQFGTGVQWHPADDFCEECTLIVTEKPAPECNAYIYAL